MGNGAYDRGFGEQWRDLLVFRREGYTTSVADYHSHPFYEVNLIFSGNIRILLADRSVETAQCHLVLTGPGVPHFISCQPDRLYKRLYLCFSEELMEAGSEWTELRRLFAGTGGIIGLTEQQRSLCETVIEQVGQDPDPLRRRLLVAYLLSHIAAFEKEAGITASPVPACVIGALSYIHKHYADRIVAEELAKRLHVGRTTLMTAFRKHTGSTLSDYVTGFRLKQAARFLREGRTVQQTADRCGFGDSGSMIRVFRKHMGVTPGQYLRQEAEDACNLQPVNV